MARQKKNTLCANFVKGLKVQPKLFTIDFTAEEYTAMNHVSLARHERNAVFSTLMDVRRERAHLAYLVDKIVKL